MWQQPQTNLLVSIESMSEADRRVSDTESARVSHAIAAWLRRWSLRAAATVPPHNSAYPSLVHRLARPS